MTDPRLKGDIVRVAMPGTLGELVQGTLDGVPCLISCPVDLFSTVELELSAFPGWHVPADAVKLRAALIRAMSLLRTPPCGGRIRLHSELPWGRGYASSTADMGAVVCALGEALGRAIAPEDVARIAVSVEPTDSSLFPGLTLWAHRDGSFAHQLGPAPEIALVLFDPGGEVDTERFNARDHARVLAELAPIHEAAFSLARKGIECGDLRALGRAATLSATAHERILPNPLLEPFHALARDVGALGICRAHSGTLLGMLLDPAASDVEAIALRTRQQLGHLGSVRLQAMVGGGPRSLTDHTTTMVEDLRALG